MFSFDHSLNKKNSKKKLSLKKKIIKIALIEAFISVI